MLSSVDPAATRLPALPVEGLSVPVAGAAGQAGHPEVLRVAVVGADRALRRRLVDVLSRTAGIEVVDGGDAVGPGGHRVPGDLLVVLDGQAAGPGTVRRPGLAPRQREVLVTYAAGNELLDVVARRLGMNTETLKTHLRRIRAKYRDVGRPAPTRRDLYVRAVQDGLLPPPS